MEQFLFSQQLHDQQETHSSHITITYNKCINRYVFIDGRSSEHNLVGLVYIYYVMLEFDRRGGQLVNIRIY